MTAADIIVQEPYGATLRSIFAIQRIRSNSFFPIADEELRERFLVAPLYHAVSLPLTVSGQFKVTVRSRAGDPVELTAFEHATELNQVFYAPALFHGVDYFVTSGAVRQRYEKNAARYQRQIRFYRLLDSYAVVAAHFRTGGTTYGPEMTIYRLGERFQEMLVQTAPTLDAYWWARAVPQAFRIQIDELLVTPDKRSEGAIRRSDGRPAHWVLSLEEPFAGYILPFLFQMTHHLTETERYSLRRRLAAAMGREAFLAACDAAKLDPKTGQPLWNKHDLSAITATRRENYNRTRQAREGRERIDPADDQRGNDDQHNRLTKFDL